MTFLIEPLVSLKFTERELYRFIVLRSKVLLFFFFNQNTMFFLSFSRVFAYIHTHTHTHAHVLFFFPLFALVLCSLLFFLRFSLFFSFFPIFVSLFF